MIRINVNIALIDMLDSVYRKPSNTPNVSIECVDTNDVYSNDTENLNNDLIENKHARLSLERRILDLLSVIEKNVIQFLPGHALFERFVQYLFW